MSINCTGIEWTDYTWNPITGCLHGCPYCYAKKITKRFPKNYPNGFNPTFYPERLDDPGKVKKPSMIFTVSMGDMFGSWVDIAWIEKIIETITSYLLLFIFYFITYANQTICQKVHGSNRAKHPKEQ